MSEPTVRLRAITEADLPNYVRWFNDAEVTELLMREPGLTLDQEREWFERLSAPDCRSLVLAIEVDGHHIGTVGLHSRDDDYCANFGITIGEKAYWGKGYGTAATRETLRIGFEERGLHRIQLEAWSSNARAIRCYRKCGFRHEGLRRHGWRKGNEWRDVVLMAILRDEWEADRNPSPFTGEGGVRVNGAAVHPHLNPSPVRHAQGRPERGRQKPGEVAIRGYRPADYDQVADVWRAVGFTLRIGDSAEALDRKVARDPDLVLVAEVGGRIVGTVMGGFDGRRAWINRLAVHPDVQRRGIGRQLMDEVERRLAGLGVTRAALEATVDRAPALRFYERLGYESHYQIIVMSKELAAPQEPSDGT
jgi:RimJ/RimL family protein N-acetyltransferase